MKRTLPLLFVTTVVLVAALAGAASAAARAAEGWQRATVAGASSALELSSVSMFDKTVGLAVGEIEQGGAVALRPAIYRTGDGGATWAQVSYEQIYGMLRGVAFSDARHAWAVGADYGSGDRQAALMLASADGGQTWKRVAIAGQEGMLSVQFPTASTGYVTADGGVLYTTTDGGATWARGVAVASDVSLYGLSFTDATHGWVCGAQGNEDWYGGRCYVTIDSGATWRDVTPDPDAVLLDGSFLPGGEGWVAGRNGRIFHTADGGESWERQSAAIGAGVDLAGIQFVDAQNGWAVGSCWPLEYGGMGWALILHTVDGGQTWVQQDCGVAPSAQSVSALDATSAWAAGNEGLVLRTGDGGGAGFTPTARPVTSALHAVKVRKGASATFRFQVTDPGVPRARVVVLIYNAKHKLKKTIVAGFQVTGTAVTHEARLTLPAGRYTWKAVCVDYAGRTQVKAGANTLVVLPATR